MIFNRSNLILKQWAAKVIYAYYSDMTISNRAVDMITWSNTYYSFIYWASTQYMEGIISSSNCNFIIIINFAFETSKLGVIKL